MTHWLEKPLIFLDIDGVLNSAAFARKIGKGGILGIDPHAVTHLQRIVDETDCSLILSSTWRHSHSLADMRGILIQHGMRHPVPLRDKTPSLSRKELGDARYTSQGRGYEVNAWISSTGFVGRYICLDDDRDFLPGQPLVKTEWETGLTAEIADECIATLRSELWTSALHIRTEESHG